MKRSLPAAVAACVIAAVPMWGHHSLAASFDSSKPVTLRGLVTKFEWNNPHVYVYLDVTSGNTTTAWEVEFDPTPDLKRMGWQYNSIQAGDIVSVEGVRARDGSNLAMGKSVTFGDGRKLLSGPADKRLAPARTGQAKATPRWPDGHPRLGPEPGASGFWADPSPMALVDMTAGNIRMDADGMLANIADAAKVAPMQPWAKGLYTYRQQTLLKDDPLAYCLLGGPRQFQDRFGLQIVDQPERRRVMILSGGFNRNWRIIDTDGRALADPEEVTPTFYGYSVGKWEGDTFVVESTAYNERFWFSNGGLPHTEALRLTERISRPDYNTLRYEVTVNDPGAYTRPWTSVTTLQWVPDREIDEYFCDDNNRETDHLSGKH